MCWSFYVGVYMGVQMSAEAKGAILPRTGVPGGGDLPDTGAGSWTRIPWKSNALNCWAISPVPNTF